MAKKKETKKKTKLQLLTAIEFVKKAQKKTGDATQQHVRLHENMAVCFDHIVAAGHPIVEDISVCAHTETLFKALKDFKDGDSITQPETSALSVQLGILDAKIPCVNPAVMHPVAPDPHAHGLLGKGVIAGLKAVDKFVKNTAETVMEASVLLQNGSLIATDREIIVEYWHGCTLTQSCVLPKAFISFVSKLKSSHKAIGYGDTRMTMFFDDDSWVRTQLFSDPWPDVTNILPTPTDKVQPLPLCFFEAVKSILNYATDNLIYFTEEGISSAREGGTTYQLIEGMVPGACIDGAKILHLRDHLSSYDVSDDSVNFFGSAMRVRICKK